MPQSLNYLKETPSQTAGPYLHIGLTPGAAGLERFHQDLGKDIAGPNARGERIFVGGVVRDGYGEPVRDLLMEVWQANAAGIYAHREDPRHGEVEEGFRGWGRAASDWNTGFWSFSTIKPGAMISPVQGPTGNVIAPHLNLWLVARGINVGLHTRMYFADEEMFNAADPVLNLIEPRLRRKTLIAERDESCLTPTYHFTIRLQGENETVFFDI